MTLEELWQLFPIILKAHDPRWRDWYEAEKEAILRAVGIENTARISHIGSSAVPGLIAKPTVDILLELREAVSPSDIVSRLKADGWVLMSEEHLPELKLSFNKGYTPKGFADKVYHLHVRRAGDWGELYFRDYLIDHPDIAESYAKLKLQLWQAYEHNRDAYTVAKTDFVRTYTQAAKEAYPGRYLLSTINETHNSSPSAGTFGEP